MRTINILSLLAVAATTSAAAVGDYSGYVQLAGNDASANQSWNAKGNWSDKTAPSSGKNY